MKYKTENLNGGSVVFFAILIVLLIGWMYTSEKKSESNNDYWSKQVEQCSKVGGFMNYKGQCEIQ